MKYLAGAIRRIEDFLADGARRVQHVFACQSCGATAPKWLGRCPDCGEWNSYVEELDRSRPPAVALRAARRSSDRGSPPANRENVRRRRCPGLDRVLGGGLVPGSVVLLGGEPGIGKSTLLLQAGRGLVARSRDVLYASAEESAGQVRLRGERLGIREGRLLVLPRRTSPASWRDAEKRTAGVRSWSIPSRPCGTGRSTSAAGHGVAGARRGAS